MKTIYNRAPLSPFVFKQEVYSHDPWKMLIICMMLNQTSYKQVDKVRDVFFSRFNKAEDLIAADNQEIIEIIRPLGFYNRRTKQWKKFSEAWLKWDGVDVSSLPGVGKYAEDSWKIFQLGIFDITVEDKELKKYIEWVNTETNHSQSQYNQNEKRD
jgi:methyl-CpG-binding domain protein 4